MLFACLLTLNLFSKDYKRYVDSVTSDMVGTDFVVVVTLTDKTTWKIIVPVLEEHKLYDIEKNLAPGEEVRIAPIRGTPLLRINNYETGITKETKALLPEIMSIEKILVEKGGWFTDPKYKYKLQLSDLSVCELLLNGPFKEEYLNWKIGDKILMQTLNRSQAVINIDASHNYLRTTGFDFEFEVW